MNEKPILMSAPMVRALLAGEKKQTRRVVKGGISTVEGMDYLNGQPLEGCSATLFQCPYGRPGDRLWVKETFRFTDAFDSDSPVHVAERCLNAGYRKPWAPIQFEADAARREWMHVGTPPHDGPPKPGKTRVSIHMPRWASRITLEITEVRVQRLREISEADAYDEGTAEWAAETVRNGNKWPNIVRAYQGLWESINGPGSWDLNPWVWAISFRRLNG